jgi:hypothetical protein
MLHVKKITILTYAHIPARMKTLKYLQPMYFHHRRHV